MGGGISTEVHANKSEKEIIALMMPLYYTHDAVITPEFLDMARNSWASVTENRAPAFVALKGTDKEFGTGVEMFYTVFYERLFDIHPMCKPLFAKGIEGQGRFLVKMMALILTTVTDKKKFHASMSELALRHCERGVKAVEFGIVGDVLFWTLERCLGANEFTPEVEDAWKKIYSSAIQIIVPLCVHYERKGVEKEASMRKTLDPSLFKKGHEEEATRTDVSNST